MDDIHHLFNEHAFMSNQSEHDKIKVDHLARQQR